MKNVYVCHSRKFDYTNELYGPLKNSSLSDKFNFIFPHDGSHESFNSKALMNANDNLIILAELSYPATGRDMELGMAYLADIPVVGLYKTGVIVEKSQKFPCVALIEYDSIDNILDELEKSLN